MNMTVVFANRQRTRKINLRLLKQMVRALLADLEIAKAELEINLVTASGMARLNEKFLHHKGPTDVITFDYMDKGGAGCPQPAAMRISSFGAIGTGLREASPRRASCPTDYTN